MRLLAALTATTALTAHIMETDTIQEVLPHVDARTWVCLDLDNTVYQSKDERGHADWILNEVNARVAKGESRQEAFHALYPGWKQAQMECEIEPIEESMLTAIDDWQKKGIAVMGITHRQLFIIPETLRQIESLGINLTKTAPSQEAFDLLGTCPARYTNGILFCDDFNDKGELLLSLLAKLDQKPEKIVFLDDRRHNVEALQTVCESVGIEYIGVHYTGMEKVGSHYAPHQLYKIVSREVWETSLLNNELRLPCFDEPFIHLATDQQLQRILNKFWKGKEAIILQVDRHKLEGDLVLEANPGGSNRYFHLYNGSIPMEAITGVKLNRVVRAAIDFGSGTVKVTAAMLHGRHPIPIMTHFEVLNLSEDVHASKGVISDPMQQKAAAILEMFKQQVSEAANGARVEFQGIATAVFRTAKNGDAVLEHFENHLGIPFQILPQEQEGTLGFLTAQVLYPEQQSDQLIAWDSGNGSYQISAESKMFGQSIGHGTVRAWLAQDVRQQPLLNRNESGNPITATEAMQLKQTIKEALNDRPEWINCEPLTFGDGQSIFALSSLALGGVERIELEKLEEKLLGLIGKSDEELAEHGLHKKTVSSMIHLAAMMEHFEFKTILYRRSTGTTPGMLISDLLW